MRGIYVHYKYTVYYIHYTYTRTLAALGQEGNRSSGELVPGDKKGRRISLGGETRNGLREKGRNGQGEKGSMKMRE